MQASKYNKNKKSLVLDMDETLVYASKDQEIKYYVFEMFDYKLIKRSGLGKFVVEIRNYYNFAIRSSASDDYTDGIKNNVLLHDWK